MDISNKKLYWRGKASAVFGMIHIMATTKPLTMNDINLKIGVN